MEKEILVQYHKSKKKYKLTRIEWECGLVFEFVGENHIRKNLSGLIYLSQNVLINLWKKKYELHYK